MKLRIRQAGIAVALLAAFALGGAAVAAAVQNGSRPAAAGTTQERPSGEPRLFFGDTFVRERRAPAVA